MLIARVVACDSHNHPVCNIHVGIPMHPAALVCPEVRPRTMVRYQGVVFLTARKRLGGYVELNLFWISASVAARFRPRATSLVRYGVAHTG